MHNSRQASRLGAADELANRTNGEHPWMQCDPLGTLNRQIHKSAFWLGVVTMVALPRFTHLDHDVCTPTATYCLFLPASMSGGWVTWTFELQSFHLNASSSSWEARSSETTSSDPRRKQCHPSWFTSAYFIQLLDFKFIRDWEVCHWMLLDEYSTQPSKPSIRQRISEHSTIIQRTSVQAFNINI